MFNQDSSPTVTTCSFNGNVVTASAVTAGFAESLGGGMYIELFGSPTIADSEFCENTPDQIEGFGYTDGGGNVISEFCPLCLADVNNDNSVNVTDLLGLLAAWGPCAAPCPPDIIIDGNVNVTDLLVLLAGWGACP